MPVVVTGADRPLGRAVVLALLAAGAPDVRALVRDRAAGGALRVAGARVSVSDLSDPLRLGAALAGAHTVVHLDAGPDGGDGPPATWTWLSEAAEDTGVRRVVTVLAPGARLPPGSGPGWEIVVLIRETRGTLGWPEPQAGADEGTVQDILAADARR